MILALLIFSTLGLGVRVLAYEKSTDREESSIIHNGSQPFSIKTSGNDGWITVPPPGKEYTQLLNLLKPSALVGLGIESVQERASILYPELEKSTGNIWHSFAMVLPGLEWFQARLIMDRDLELLTGNSKLGNNAGSAYKAILDEFAACRAQATGFEAAMDKLWELSGAKDMLEKGPHPPIKRSQRWLPASSSLDATHQYALDIFFTEIKRDGASEIGPEIFSIGRGIVVASGNDWEGGDTLASYKGGGLSPKSGNGLIIYSPDDGYYYAYFHLHSVNFQAGEIVKAGDLLGLGGNTGANARKKGHGGHLHLEVHTGINLAMRNRELSDMVAGLY